MNPQPTLNSNANPPLAPSNTSSDSLSPLHITRNHPVEYIAYLALWELIHLFDTTYHGLHTYLAYADLGRDHGGIICPDGVEFRFSTAMAAQAGILIGTASALRVVRNSMQATLLHQQAVALEQSYRSLMNALDTIIATIGLIPREVVNAVEATIQAKQIMPNDPVLAVIRQHFDHMLPLMDGDPARPNSGVKACDGVFGLVWREPPRPVAPQEWPK